MSDAASQEAASDKGPSPALRRRRDGEGGQPGGADGRSGLALALSTEIDLILCDVILPEMSGQELGRRMRAIRPDIPVLYMSGYPGLDVVERGLIAHDAPFIEKPFSATGLASSVRGLLNDNHAATGRIPT